MVVEQVGRHQPFKMPLIQDDHVVQQVASATSHPALRNTVLPRTAKGRASWLASHVPYSRNHLGSKLRVAVEWQESVRLFVDPCFSQLLYNPKCIGISRQIEMQDRTPVVADDEKAVQNTKRERWDGEEIHRRNDLAMVSEERQPSLRRIWISRSSPDPPRDAPFREIETQLDQLAVNARCSPGRILGSHTEDQRPDLFTDTLPSSYLADSGDPRPTQTKPRSMPVHDGPRSDQDERLSPPGPERSQRNPEQLVLGCQSTARLLRVQSQQLPTESQVFEDEVLPGTESAHQPAEEMSERHDHGKDSSGKIRIQSCAKSFILQVYDVLAKHTLHFELFLCRAVGDSLGVAACSNHRLDFDYHTRPADLIPLDEV